MSIFSKNNNSRTAIVNRDWTQGNILTNLLQLSWPMAVTQTMMSLGPTIDMVWVGRLGPSSMAAVGVSGVAVMLAQGAMMGLTTGMRALIARHIGAKETDEANHVAQQAIVICALYSILMAVIGIFLSDQLIRLITKDPEVVRLGATYLRIQLIGAFTMSFRMMMDAIMQASGDSINPMQIAIVYRLLHIALCPFLIFGWLFFPELGVSGAAYTSVITQFIGVMLGMRVLFGRRSRLHLSLKNFQFSPVTIWRIVRIGLPSAVTSIQRSLNQFVIQVFLAPFGVVVLAAHTLIQRLEMVMMTPTMSFGQGAGVLLGQNLGANQPQRAEKSGWMAVMVVEIFAVVISLAFFIWTIPVIRIFSSDPIMDDTAVQFIHIAIVGWIFMGFANVITNALQGAGDTVPPMLISVISNWIFTIPLAYLLPKYTDFGVLGIRWALTVSFIVASVANVIYFRTGRWKTRRV